MLNCTSLVMSIIFLAIIDESKDSFACAINSFDIDPLSIFLFLIVCNYGF